MLARLIRWSDRGCPESMRRTDASFSRARGCAPSVLSTPERCSPSQACFTSGASDLGEAARSPLAGGDRDSRLSAPFASPGCSGPRRTRHWRRRLYRRPPGPSVARSRPGSALLPSGATRLARSAPRPSSCPPPTPSSRSQPSPRGAGSRPASQLRAPPASRPGSLPRRAAPLDGETSPDRPPRPRDSRSAPLGTRPSCSAPRTPSGMSRSRGRVYACFDDSPEARPSRGPGGRRRTSPGGSSSGAAPRRAATPVPFRIGPRLHARPCRVTPRGTLRRSFTLARSVRRIRAGRGHDRQSPGERGRHARELEQWACSHSSSSVSSSA